MPITISANALKYKTSQGTYKSISAVRDNQLTQQEKAEIAQQVNYTNFIQEVEGSAVTITGVANIQYICGEVTSISITPPASGTIIVRFTSGSTAAVLTLPSTVIMPDWWMGIDANRTYEICIEDGVYGSVISWALS